MKFREWLKLREVSTSTADVAGFSRPIFSGEVRRKFADTICADPFFNKKKKEKENEDEE